MKRQMQDTQAYARVWLPIALGLLLEVALATHALAGEPNIEGTWKIATPQSALKSVGGEAIPFTASGAQAYEQNKSAAGRGDYGFDLTMTRCSAPGLPRLMLTPDRFKIFQRPRIITFVFEWNRLARQIDMRDQTPQQPLYGTAQGLSYGHWEGDFLVVQSLGFSTKRLLDNLIPNSEELQLVEHIRLRNKDTLEDRISINDPGMFTHPWDAVLIYKRQANETFPEDVCLDRKDAGQLPLPH